MLRTAYKAMITVLVIAGVILSTACSSGTGSTGASSPGQEGAGGGETSSEPVPSANVSYPQRPITLIVGSSPGGGYDRQGRLLAQHWPRFLPGNAVMNVVNEVGAGGISSANQAWVAPPDGYETIQLKVGAYLMEQALHPDVVRFDMLGWKYIGQYTVDVNAVAVRSEIAERIRSWDDMTAAARQEPLVVGTGGAGGTSHMKALVVSLAGDVPMRMIHYPGSAETQTGMLRGEADFTFTSASSLATWDPEGIKLLFIADTERFEGLPDVPTAEEFGVPADVLERILNNPAFSSPRAMAVAPGTPDEIVSILRDSFMKMLQDDEVKAAFRQSGDLLRVLPGDEFESRIQGMWEEARQFAPILAEELE